MEEVEEKPFSFADKIDLHALNFYIDLAAVVAISGEHGFRGIVVGPSKIGELSKLINNQIFGCKDVIPICIIDYPFGMSSSEVRACAMYAAKEKGAKEIEIVVPYPTMAEKDFKLLHEDASNIVKFGQKENISVKYVIDQNSPYLDEATRSRMYRILASVKMPIVTTSLGFFDEKLDQSNDVLKMRALKSKVPCQIKSYISSGDIEDMIMYIKAGCDIIGLDWDKASNLLYEYQSIVEKKN